MTSFRLLTLNIHHGVSMNGDYSLNFLVESIKKLECDVICLQELDAFSPRTKFHHQPKRISQMLEFSLQQSRIRFFGAGFQYNAILSRFNFVSSFSSKLPSGPKRFGMLGPQARTALLSVIEIDGTQIGITTTHLHSQGRLSDNNPLAQKQLEFIYSNVSSDKGHVVAGDFNLIPRDVIPIAEKYNFESPSKYLTSPADNPKHQIDWITGMNVEIDQVEVTEELSSDHRGVIATITF